MVTTLHSGPSILLVSKTTRFFFFFSGRRRHTRYWRDWSSDVCSSDLGRVDLLAPLIKTGAGEILWSEKIDSPARDLITLQDTIAERVISRLKLKLTEEEQEKRSEERRVGKE